MRAIGAKGMGGSVRLKGSGLERLEGGVALDGLGERHAALGAELVAAEPARTAQSNCEKGRVQRGCMMWWLKARASGFDCRAADSSFFRVMLLLSASASAMPPSGPSLL